MCGPAYDIQTQCGPGSAQQLQCLKPFCAQGRGHRVEAHNILVKVLLLSTEMSQGIDPGQAAGKGAERSVEAHHVALDVAASSGVE